MHIVIFTSVYPNRKFPHKSPFVKEQALALASQHQVTVIAPELCSWREVRERRCVVELSPPLTIYRPRCWYIPGIWWLYYVLTSFWCTRDLNWKEVTLIHGHFSIPAGFTAALLSRWYRKPFVLTEHYGRFATLVKPLIRGAVAKWSFKQAQRTIVVSRTLRDTIEQTGVQAHFEIVPNIVDTALFQPAPASERQAGTFELLWVGSLVPIHYRNKGIVELLQAMAIAVQELKLDVHLNLIGGGAALTECINLARELNIQEQCNFLGGLSHVEVRDWMQKCDALVVASYIESFSVVLVEALACGKPVLATRCGGPEEILAPETGILVPARDPKALAEGMQRLIETYHTFDSQKIVPYVERFSPARVADQLTNIYHDVLSEKRENVDG